MDFELGRGVDANDPVQMHATLAKAVRRREADEAARVAEQRATSGREPFSMAELRAHYPVDLDLRGRPLEERDVRSYERRYYLWAPPEVRTMEAFAAYLSLLRDNGVG
ncbi:hypothetical protein EDD29_7486 [Actinocorallia herbida]|uniref:Uncharacterized protein n=1 Tax=Actinocorallia herbida TaxID=58109 RepID=A0A3N1D9L1_9ACTN|nr:hypothetical protein [Actinocorallia herbida]ROO89778.1 hypothetical protein EDD29_7486 [Actinocorallia herbida]